MSSTTVRAEIVLALKDELSRPIAKAGDAGKGALKDLNSGAANLIQRFTGLNVAALGATAVIGGLAAGLHYAVQQAAEAEKIMAVTGAVVKATGNAAGLTAEQIAAMAGRLSQLNAVDDEVIQSAQNVLLTFKKIKGEAFEQASQAALDLSVVMGGDLRGAMMMVGKALEDPVRGITALRRAGVSFTAEQQKTIKALVETGQQAKAMDMILAELNSQVGGAGVAAANTYAGQVALLKINIDNLAQSIGEGLIPPLTEATKALNLLITWQDKVDNALVDHQANVLVTAKSYDAYIAEIERAQIASGNYYRDHENVVRGISMETRENKQLTESQFLVARGLAMVTDRTEDYHGRLNEVTAATDTSTTATSDLAHGYARMGEEANAGGGKAVEAIQAIQAAEAELANARLQQAVNAGLDGTLTTAWEDYKSVIADTQPEIDALIVEIERMQAAHGKTFTMTTAATASIEEYKLAQLKAAEAQTKANEATNDGSIEYYELQVAAQTAQEKVGKLGEQMGMSQTFTADYTKKLMEANGSLSELEAKQLTAEEALRRTTAEFIYQQLAVEGDAKANLALALNLGILDEASYNASLALLDLKGQYEEGAISAENYGRMSGLAADAIARLQDKNVTVTYTTVWQEIHRGVIQEATQAAGGQGGGVTPGTYDPKPGQAMGGPVRGGQSYVVGEQGPEVFTPATSGHITPNHNLGGSVTFAAGAIVVNVPQGDARAISAAIAGELRRALKSGVAGVGA